MVKKKAIEIVKNTRKSIRSIFKETHIKRKVYLLKNDSDSSETDESDVSSDISFFMVVENHNDEFIEEEEGEVDLEAELVSALTKLRKVRR